MTTLIEELEQAETRARIMAQETDERSAGVRWKHLRDIHLAEAARLRARAERIRELERQANGPGEELLRNVIRALAGPLDTPPETPGKPTTCPTCGRPLNQEAIDTGCRIMLDAGQRVIRCGARGTKTPLGAGVLPPCHLPACSQSMRCVAAGRCLAVATPGKKETP